MTFSQIESKFRSELVKFSEKSNRVRYVKPYERHHSNIQFCRAAHDVSNIMWKTTFSSSLDVLRLHILVERRMMTKSVTLS